MIVLTQDTFIGTGILKQGSGRTKGNVSNLNSFEQIAASIA